MKLNHAVVFGMLASALSLNAQAASSCEVAGMYRDLTADGPMKWEIGDATVSNLSQCVDRLRIAEASLAKEDRMVIGKFTFSDALWNVTGSIAQPKAGAATCRAIVSHVTHNGTTFSHSWTKHTLDAVSLDDCYQEAQQFADALSVTKIRIRFQNNRLRLKATFRP